MREKFYAPSVKNKEELYQRIENEFNALAEVQGLDQKILSLQKE